jgi:MtrB/PioB family decaheme-associated outer membrane protein
MRLRVLVSSLVGSLILAGATVSAATAQTAGTTAATDPWYFHGDLEVGGRFFANNPNKDGIASLGQSSLGKYYEYTEIKPGAFFTGWLSTGSKNGLYKIDAWGDNVGYKDQHFEVGASKAGEFYFNGVWDQTPHVYSTNAQTLYGGIGTNALTLPGGLAAKLHTDCGDAAACATPGTAQTDITNNLYTTELGIRRDTAAADFRWTPTDAWDFKVAYSNMHRTGSQVDGIAFGPGTTNIGVAQVPKPVDDTTQNYSATGEYVGTSPWGQRFNFKVGYGGSMYTDKWNSYTVEDPFCPLTVVGVCGPGTPGGTGNGGTNYAPSALVSLWPSNQSNGFNATLGADLPMKSRYMGTVSYIMMRQNEGFLPFTNNTNPWLNGQPNPTLPASSLNGAINTFLSNNVLTTDITSTLRSKLSYRYYNYDNETPELLFNDFILTDTTSANNRTTAYAPVHSLSVSYVKQNAGADLDWRPDHHWNVGVGYGFERYDWTRADSDVTNEHQGKAFVDYKPWTWLTSRLSGSISDRRYDNYDYRGFVGVFQWTDPTCATVQCGSQYSNAYRQFYLDNRVRGMAKYSVAIDVLRGLTVTPTASYQEDNYSISNFEAGLTRVQAIKAGVEVAYAIDPYTTFLFSYMNEISQQQLKYTNAASGAMTAANVFHADVRDTVDTFMGAVTWAAIPDQLDFKLSYTLSLSKDSQPQLTDAGVAPAVQYPDVRGQWSRLEAQAKYTFDKTWTKSMGFNGEAYAKLRYVWERNSVDNLDQDIMTPYFLTLNGATTLQRMTWMAFDNPNYDVQLIAASFGLKW